MGGLIEELVVQNYAYSVKGFARDLDQAALRKARRWRVPIQIGILAGFGKRTTSTQDLKQMIKLSRERGHGAIFFYWEGLCGTHRRADNVNRCWHSWTSLLKHPN